jgi:hypothetical protein
MSNTDVTGFAEHTQGQPKPTLPSNDQIGSQVAKTPATNTTTVPETFNPVPPIKIILHIPESTNRIITMSPWTAGGERLKQAMHDKFNADYLSTEFHRRRYSNITKNQEKYIQLATCVDKVLYTGGRKSKEMVWSTADGNEERACDGCFAAKRLCARLTRRGEDTELVIYPLAEGYRVGKYYDNMAYWVDQRS